MTNKKMFLWLTKYGIKKAILDFNRHTAEFYDVFGNLQLTRKGLSNQEMLKLERQIKKIIKKQPKVKHIFWMRIMKKCPI